ncbi:MAG TPA: hypothetical protein VM261_36615 [Kofleriaceae bacterium]|nr:hypothetical protein [Kofleriaceae bacterium]
MFAYIKLDQYWSKHYASAEVLSAVSLDDGAMLASERIEREKRRRDPNTDQVEYSQELHYRLRRYDQQTGSDQARRLINGAATCVAAGQGRAWCSWETGHAYLLDAKLETVGEADHMPGPPDPLQWHYNGVPAWTADLPEPPDSARLDGETVVLVGRTRSVAIAGWQRTLVDATQSVTPRSVIA